MKDQEILYQTEYDELRDGLSVLEFDNRLEMIQISDFAEDSQRCDFDIPIIF